MKYIIKYLKGTTCKCLWFGNNDAFIVGYIDLDYGGCADSRRSRFGYIFLFARGAISWRSCLQSCSLSSTIEGEYVVVSCASKEFVFLSH